MPLALSDKQIAQFRNDGFLAPVDAFNREESAALFERFIALRKSYDGDFQHRFRTKAHLPFPWLCDLIRHPKLVDPIEDLIGPNILCWGSTFFVKNPGDKKFISWHTDTFFYGFEPAETIALWLAFSDSTRESGGVKFIPGTHKGPRAEHELRPDPNNLSSNGQTVIDVDEDKAVLAELRAGQFSLHHESVVHGSEPNNSNHARVGMSIHYIAPHVRETRFEGATAMLVRGRDTHGFWTIEPEPERDFDPHCLEHLDRNLALYREATNRKIKEGGRT